MKMDENLKKESIEMNHSVDLNRQSKIVDFYSKKSIFITGASGFIGKVLIEKLLRTCSDLDKIYILLRSKKGQSSQKRVDKEFTFYKLFEKVDKNLIKSKLIPIEGDLTSSGLGLSADDLSLLCSNVNIVFHLAASVRFDDPLKECIRYNVLGTKSVLDLCHQMTSLECFVHVSTAYAYCHLERTEECLYPLKASVSQIIEACNWMDQQTLKKCAQLLAEGRPNTYTLTKAMAEHYVNANCGKIPTAIARPSIVTSSFKEPIAGWTDSINGPAGTLLLGCLGIARTMMCTPKNKADFIPIDIVTNALIAIAWRTANDHKLQSKDNSDIADRKMTAAQLPVYNITSGDVNPITWEQFLEYGVESYYTRPSIKLLRLPAKPPKGDKVKWFKHITTKIFSETLFAYVVDFILLLIGQKTLLVRLVQRMHSAFNLLEFFTNKQFSLPCNNLLSLYDSLDEIDKKLFAFDIRIVNWRSYTNDFVIGMRRYLLKEEDDNIPKALKRMKRLKIGYTIANVTFLILFILLAFWLLPALRTILCYSINSFWTVTS